MKIKHFLFGAIMSLAMTFGVGASFFSLNSVAKEEPVAVEAASTACDVYFKAKWTGATIQYAKVHYWNGGDYWKDMTEVYTDGGYKVYKYTIPAGNNEFQYQTYTSNWGSGEWHTSVNKVVSNNLLCWPTETWDGSNFNLNTGTAYPYTITYNANGGTGTMANDNAYGNVQWGLKTNTFTRSGYDFAGWNTQAGGGGISYADKALLPTKTNTTTVNLYAQWTAKTYTMTFKPNGGSGSEVTRSKTHGVTYTVPTPESLGIGAGAARVMLSWNENQDGSGTSYKIDGTSTYTGNSAKTFWLQQGFKSYEYSVDGGSTWVQMPQIDTAADCVATYASSASNYLPAGQAITVRGYYGSGTHTSQTINVWTGNQYESGGSHYVSIGTYNKIVLYVTNSGSFNLDVWGGSSRGVAIDRSGFVTKYECTLDETTHNFTGTITVLPGDKIEAYYNYATVYAVTMTNYASYGVDVNGNVSVPAVYVLTVTYKSADNYPTINIDSMVAVDTSKLIAQTFNNDMTPLCSAIEGGYAPSTLVTQWGTESGYYSKLSAATKNILNGTTSSSDTDVLAMRLKYDRIVGKYSGSVSGINDYMSRNPAPIGRSTFSPIVLLADNNNSTVVIIIVSTLVAVSAVGGYFLLRKRKEQ